MKNKILAGLIVICFGSVKAQELKCLDVAYKLAGYFYAGTSIADSDASGGFYEDGNIPRKNNRFINQISVLPEFRLIAKTDSIVEFQKGVKGFKVFLVNKTDSIIKLPAADSRIDIIRQVFYNNKWQDVEYLPYSSCGNSYHAVYINPDEYWDFTAPCIEGKIRTKFRFALHIGITDRLVVQNIYSNEFEGSFNKKQLTKEQRNKPINLMDPYQN